MHGTGRSYVYARDYSGSTHHDRGYLLHGACGEEVVGSQEGKKIFDVFIQGGKFVFRTLHLCKSDTLRARVPASIRAKPISIGRNFIYGNMIGVGKAGEFGGRKEGINISYYSFPNMSLNRSYRARVHVLKRVRGWADEGKYSSRRK